MSERKTPRRMDFELNIISNTTNADGSLTAYVEMIPDPNRYEKFEKNGEIFYKDKFTDLVIPLKVLADGWEKCDGLPIYYSPPKQGDYCEYIKTEKKNLLRKWKKRYNLQPSEIKINDFLKDVTGSELLFVILFVDMAGSTKISASVNSKINAKINRIFLMQMSKIIDNYGGYILKYVGDCVIGIFPAEHNYTGMCDNSIQAAMTMVGLIEDVINPIFKSKGLPTIGCHIGIDIGKVLVDNVGARNIGSFVDLIGYPMNLTAKIQSKAGNNDILIGKTLFENLHCNWQEYAKKIDVNLDLQDPYSDKKYEIYRFSGRYNCTKK